MRATRSKGGSHAPPLSNMWFAGGLTLLILAAATGLVYLGLESLRPVTRATGRRTESANTLDVIKTAIAVVAFAGAALSGVYAYRKQRLAEGDAHRSDRHQFGRPLHVRGRSTRARPASGPARRRLRNRAARRRLVPPAADVHRGHVRVIRDHLRTDRGLTSWQGYNFSFQGAVFEEGDLSHTHFSDGHVSFHGARFVSGTFHFSGAHFAGASVVHQRALQRRRRELLAREIRRRVGHIRRRQTDRGGREVRRCAIRRNGVALGIPPHTGRSPRQLNAITALAGRALDIGGGAHVS